MLSETPILYYFSKKKERERKREILRKVQREIDFNVKSDFFRKIILKKTDEKKFNTEKIEYSRDVLYILSRYWFIQGRTATLPATVPGIQVTVSCNILGSYRAGPPRYRSLSPVYRSPCPAIY